MRERRGKERREEERSEEEKVKSEEEKRGYNFRDLRQEGRSMMLERRTGGQDQRKRR